MTGVLLMAHGTPSSLDEMPEYLTRVRGGRPPSPALLGEMRHNYEAIGGRSPLTDLTFAQGAALHERLGLGVPVSVGMRNWHPFISDAVERLIGTGVRRVIAIPLAPQFSSTSVAKYYDAVGECLPVNIEMVRVDPYFEHPLLAQAFAERVLEAAPEPDEEIVFTAHSIPQRAVADGDPYLAEVAATARGVAARAGIAQYHQAFQSAGRTPEPWVGPDLGEFLEQRVDAGARRFLVVPVGFVCDHTEILFDIDVQAAQRAADLGATLRRTASLNTSGTFIALLESLVRDRL